MTDDGPLANTVVMHEPGFAARKRVQLSTASSRCGETTLKILDMAVITKLV